VGTILFLVPPSGFAADVGQPPLPERTSVTIRGRSIEAEVARSALEQSRGLSGRPRLEPATGMVFPYPKPSRLGFWMKDMRFDLDLVWIRDGRIVDISEFVPAPRAGASLVDALATVHPREPADTVLEVVAGTARARGWAPGDAVSFSPPVR
jgi:uncharacterized membrane protein (UPF0127 family)